MIGENILCTRGALLFASAVQGYASQRRDLPLVAFPVHFPHGAIHARHTIGAAERSRARVSQWRMHLDKTSTQDKPRP